VHQVGNWFVVVCNLVPHQSATHSIKAIHPLCVPSKCYIKSLTYLAFVFCQTVFSTAFERHR